MVDVAARCWMLLLADANEFEQVFDSPVITGFNNLYVCLICIHTPCAIRDLRLERTIEMHTRYL